MGGVSVVYVIGAVCVVNEINVLSYFGVLNVDTVVGLVFVVECSQWPRRVGGVDHVSVVNVVGGVVAGGIVTVASQCSWWLVGEVDVVDVVSVVSVVNAVSAVGIV